MIRLSKPPVGAALNYAHPLTRDLRELFPGGEGSGGATRGVVNGYVLTATNVAQGATSGWTGGRAGGHALRADGTNDRWTSATMPPRLNVTGGRISVAVWLKPNSFGGGSRSRIVDCLVLSTTGYLLTLDNTNTTNGLAFAINSGIIGTSYGYAADAITLGVWQHVAVTMNGTDLRFYVNGQRVTTTSGFTDTTITSSTQAWNLAGRSSDDTRNYDGVLEMCGVWSRTLNADEVTQLYAQPFAMFARRRRAA